jgi:hypothetical protein
MRRRRRGDEIAVHHLHRDIDGICKGKEVAPLLQLKEHEWQGEGEGRGRKEEQRKGCRQWRRRSEEEEEAEAGHGHVQMDVCRVARLLREREALHTVPFLNRKYVPKRKLRLFRKGG